MTVLEKARTLVEAGECASIPEAVTYLQDMGEATQDQVDRITRLYRRYGGGR